MEGIPTNVYKGIRGYWKRKGYKKLNKNSKNHDQPDPVEPGSDLVPNPVGRRRRRFFRVKINRRMRIWRRVFGVPKKWLTRLRDGYVKMMLNLANSGLAVGGASSGFGGAVDYGYGFGTYRGQLKEYDEKVLVEIYKSLMIAQGQLGGPPNVNPQQHLRSSPKFTIPTR